MTIQTSSSGDATTRRCSRHSLAWALQRTATGILMPAFSFLAGCAAPAASSSSTFAVPSPGMARFSVSPDTLFFARSAAFQGGSLLLRVTNAAGVPLYVERCGNLSFPGFVLERESAGEWQVEYSAICPSVLELPIVVAPGTNETFPLPVAHSIHPDARPRFRSDDPSGTYRLVVTSAFWRYDAATSERAAGLASDERRTPSFAVVLR